MFYDDDDDNIKISYHDDDDNIKISNDDGNIKISADDDDYEISGLDKNGLDENGYNINGLDENYLDGNGYNINGIKGTKIKYPNKKLKYKKGENNILYDQYGFDKDGFSKNLYDMYGFDKNGLNKNGFNIYGYEPKSNKVMIYKRRFSEEQKGKRYVDLPILLSKMYTNNNSKKLINDIEQLVKNVYDNKQITKQVYNILNKAIKMTRKEQVKILDDKIKANERQYDLDRTNAEISAYSSGDLPNYEYLTKKDLKYKPDAFEQAKFEYSPLGKVFTDGLDKSDKNEGLLERLENIEDKNNNQLIAIENILRPEIKGKNNGGFKSDDDDYNNKYNK